MYTTRKIRPRPRPRRVDLQFMRMVPIGNRESIVASTKRLAWLEIMLPIIFFFPRKVFPVISLLVSKKN